MQKVKRLVLDFETRSAFDLKAGGAYLYSKHFSTQPTCLAFKDYQHSHIYFLDFKEINTPWGELRNSAKSQWLYFLKNGYEFTAHNAFFEQCIYNHILVGRLGWPKIDSTRWRCTAAKAAACALPRSLEGAGEALNLFHQKDKRGYAAMMQTCKPTRQFMAWTRAKEELALGKKIGPKKRALAQESAPSLFLEPHHAPHVWETLYQYCKKDILTEQALDEALPDLIPREQELWLLNQKINMRGISVDFSTIQKVVSIMEKESVKKLKELDQLTMGLVTKPGARQSILDFLKIEGIELPDIRAQTISDVLKAGKLSPDMKRLLEIRQMLSKTSTKKYHSFLNRTSRSDFRVRDLLLYHGASTGRDSGTGIQPHNFPRGVMKVDKNRPYATVENVAKLDYKMLLVLYGETLPLVFSSILRNMFIPSQGRELFVADFSKIEVAVLWWLADNTPGIQILKSGKDPYKYQAAANTGKRYEDILDDSDDRQLGKAQVLGCGFGMGWEKFLKAAFDQYRLSLTPLQAAQAVKAYRKQNERVPALWNEYEEAAIRAVRTGKRIKAGKCFFYFENKFLWVKLPSGRKLAYYKPQLVWRNREYTSLEIHPKTGKTIQVKRTTEYKETLEFLGLGPDKKKMRLERTWGGTLTENIVQAVARDLMMEAIVRLEKRGYQALLTIHDEAICEIHLGHGNLEEFTEIMCEAPAWADDQLVVDAKGWNGKRYRK